MQAVIKRCAGLDVHKMVIVGTVIVESDNGDIQQTTREFTTFKKGRRDLTQWLQSEMVELVVMESTGVYWKSTFASLENVGIKTWVVNARHVKNVPGRKTDVIDSQWLAQLARCGLVRPSFIPNQVIRELRLLTRRRQKVSSIKASEKLRLHKLLDEAGIRLGGVVSDINGKSAQAMIEGLINGLPAAELAQLAKGRLRAKLPPLFHSLDEPLTADQRFLLQELQEHIQYLDRSLEKLDARIFAVMNEHFQCQWQFLQTIPGIDRLAAALLIAEIGADMTQFSKADHLASWAGICPGNNESAGKRKSGRTRKGNVWLKRLLCEIAHAASRTDSQFQGYFKSLVVRRGVKRSIFAVAHKILRIVFCMLKNQQHYIDPGINYEERVVKRNASRWLRALHDYGYVTFSSGT